MTTSTLLAAGTTAVTSSDFTVAAGQPVRVAMTVTSTTARMTVHSVVLGVESLYAALSQSDPGVTISAPGVYRVKRPALSVASGVEVSTLVENHVEAAVGALTGATAGIADPVGGVGAYNIARGAVILNGASAGADSGWLPMSDAPERFAYQLDSGSTATTFSVDISADGVTSLGQAFTGTWASSSLAEITFPIMFSNPLAKFFRWNVVSGGPLSVSRGV